MRHSAPCVCPRVIFSSFSHLELQECDGALAHGEGELEVVEGVGPEPDILQPNHPTPQRHSKLLPRQIHDVLSQDPLEKRSEQPLKHPPDAERLLLPFLVSRGGGGGGGEERISCTDRGGASDVLHLRAHLFMMVVVTMGAISTLGQLERGGLWSNRRAYRIFLEVRFLYLYFNQKSN